jgi:hypothetical protein
MRFVVGVDGLMRRTEVQRAMRAPVPFATDLLLTSLTSDSRMDHVFQILCGRVSRGDLGCSSTTHQLGHPNQHRPKMDPPGACTVAV